jgi:TRAP-type transport system periplasmic protein
MRWFIDTPFRSELTYDEDRRSLASGALKRQGAGSATHRRSNGGVKMNAGRRVMIKAAWTLGAILSGLSVTAPECAAADGPVTLKFGFPAPVSSFVNTQGMTPWIEKVEKASGGTLKIRLFAGPTLGTFSDIYDRTLNNVSQISFGVLGPLVSEFPRTQVTDLPFLSTDTKKSSVALWRLYEKGLLAPEFDRVKVLALFNFTSSNINAKKPIKLPEDLAGLKVAAGSREAGELALALGASPITLTPTEIYEAMNRGVVNAAFGSWTLVKTFKLTEVTNFHLELPLGEAPAYVFMNKATYASLPPQAKKAIDQFSGESFSEILGANNQAADRAEGQKVSAEAGQTVTKLAAADYPAWKARMQPVVDAWVKNTPDGAKLLAAYREELAKLGESN